MSRCSEADDGVDTYCLDCYSCQWRSFVSSVKMKTWITVDNQVYVCARP